MVKDLEAKFKYPIAGSLRIGEKNERNIPKKLDYFTVHEDSHTITDVVNQFNSKYNKPKELIIRFITDDPFETSYLRYGKSGLLCKGDGESASSRGEKDWLECECSKDCTHRGKDCFLTGRLYFLIKGINIGGLWRLQTQSYNTIQNFLTTLNFLKCMGVDIKQKEFRIATEENTRVVDGKVNKYTTISLKMLEGSSKTKVEEINTEPKESKNKEITAKPKETKVESEKADENALKSIAGYAGFYGYVDIAQAVENNPNTTGTVMEFLVPETLTDGTYEIMTIVAESEKANENALKLVADYAGFFGYVDIAQEIIENPNTTEVVLQVLSTSEDIQILNLLMECIIK